MVNKVGKEDREKIVAPSVEQIQMEEKGEKQQKETKNESKES